MSLMKANCNLCYFFCHRGLYDLTDSAIEDHDFYTFLLRRFKTLWRYNMQIVSYCNDTVSYFDENSDPRNDDD